MTKMIKNLTVANIKKIEGMVRREDLDFSDDGNRFRGFSYKGMPITTLRRNDETYLAIRVDYLENEFTSKEWMNTEEYRLADEFNGVFEICLDKLIENLEKIITKVAQMNEEAKAEEIDTTKVEARLVEEIEYAKSVVEEFKKNFKWYEADFYKVKCLIDYLKSEEREIEFAESIDFNSMSGKEKRIHVERLNEYGYVKIRKDGFYIKEMLKAMN